MVSGKLEVICGGMFSGKSEELLRRLRRSEIAGNRVVLAKPDIDHRYGKNHVISHAGHKMPCLIVKGAGDLRAQTFGYDVVGVDEAQFFDEALPAMVKVMTMRQTVIVSGLDMTYRREPFEPNMPTLMAMADKLDKLTAICHKCGNEATLTQRLIDGKPAPFAGDTIQVGGLDSYEARCRECHQVA